MNTLSVVASLLFWTIYLLGLAL